MSTHTENVIAEVLAERHRQVHDEAWTPSHDDRHDCREMARAAACYAIGRESVERGFRDEGGSATVSVNLWPWDVEWWKPKSQRRNLIRAAALIVAEIERLDRAKARGLVNP